MATDGLSENLSFYLWEFFEEVDGTIEDTHILNELHILFGLSNISLYDFSFKFL